MGIFFIYYNNSISQSLISRQNAIDDIDFYHKTIRDVHYNPFLFIEEKKYFEETEKLKKTITDSISVNDFIILLYRLSSLLKDSHTAPYIVQAVIIDELKKAQFFPYNLIVDKSRIYVPQSTSRTSLIPAGAEIVSINNVPVNTLLPGMEKYIGGNDAYGKEMAGKLFSYFLFLSNIKAPFQIQYLDRPGNKKEKTIATGLKFMEALSVTMPHLKNEYTFKIVSGKLGYIDFMSMSGDLNSFDQFLDSCFTVIKKNNIKQVAIDIRKNSGGNSILGDLLFSYINTKKYSLMGSREWKVSSQYKEYLVSNGDTANQYLEKENGSIWELGNCQPTESKFKNDNIFSGNVYLLTGPFTFSSANMIADGAKQFKVAELVGEPTGEDTNDFGETYVFALPNSKIKMQTTTSFDHGADCDKNIHRPVIPDKLIGYSLRDKIDEKDKALEYILGQIK